MGIVPLLLILAPKLFLRYHDIVKVLLPMERLYFEIASLLKLEWLLVPHHK